MIDFTKSEKEIADYFMLICNCFGFKYEKYTEEFKESKDMKKLALYWLQTISTQKYEEWHVDLRNEISARKGRELVKISFIKKKLEKLPEKDKMKNVCENYILYDHPTILQVFSGFCFCFILKNCCTELQQKKLIDEFGERFYSMPMI